MPRKRMIDPELWHDKKVIALKNTALIVFIGAISSADDEGIIEPDPKSFFYQLAREEMAIDDIAAAFQELFTAGLLVPYDDYAFIPTWFKHQYIEKPVPTKRRRPPADLLTEDYIAGWEKTFNRLEKGIKYPFPDQEADSSPTDPGSVGDESVSGRGGQGEGSGRNRGAVGTNGIEKKRKEKRGIRAHAVEEEFEDPPKLASGSKPARPP